MTTKSKATPVVSTPEQQVPSKPQTVLTTAPGQIGPYGYIGGLLLTDVPPDVIAGNPGWMSTDPDAVKAAKAAGAAVLLYRG